MFILVLFFFFSTEKLKSPYCSLEGATRGQKSIVYGCVVWGGQLHRPFGNSNESYGPKPWKNAQMLMHKHVCRLFQRLDRPLKSSLAQAPAFIAMVC